MISANKIGTLSQLKVIRDTANQLDSFTRDINRRLGKLETMGNSLQEGVLGWFSWVARRGEARTMLLELTTSLSDLSVSTGRGVLGTDEYLAVLQQAKGVASPLDQALDRHVSAIRRVREATLRVKMTCDKAIELLKRDNSTI